MVKLAEEPLPEVEKWMLHVDDSSNGGASILIQGPKSVEIKVTVKLSFSATNKEAEYERWILGLELAYEAGARNLEVYTDSQLVAMQIDGTYETREKTMVLYQKKAKELVGMFDKCVIQQIPRSENDKGDALSKFGAMM
ncbi:UNVERIFIED_CONTAM: hypothetical protein Sindi_1258800 [Sesamum indicum]